MKTAVRISALDMSGLAKAEDHGKRLDASSQRRRIRDDSPLAIGGLDLRPLYDAHVAGCRMNASAKKPVLHMIVRMPPELLDGDDAGPFVGSRKDRQRLMLDMARRWADASHGGNAVFAARLDRDEEGETVCDLFLAPRYTKETKRKKGDDAEVWVSATKFGKTLAEKHQDEIKRRHSGTRCVLTSPRAVGIALQSDWRAFFEAETGLRLAAKVEKGSSAPDRLEKEQHDRIVRAKAEASARTEAARVKALAEVEAAQAALDVRERLLVEREARAERARAEAESAHKRVMGELVGLELFAGEAAAGRLHVRGEKITADRSAEVKAALPAAPVAWSLVASLLRRFEPLRAEMSAWLKRPDLSPPARESAEKLRGGMSGIFARLAKDAGTKRQAEAERPLVRPSAPPEPSEQPADDPGPFLGP